MHLPSNPFLVNSLVCVKAAFYFQMWPHLLLSRFEMPLGTVPIHCLVCADACN